MATGISPSIAFAPSVFYDPDNNPLNIPCEGPRVVPIQLNYDSSVLDNDYTINFNQLFQSGQMSCVQSVFINLHPLADANPQSRVLMTFGGTQQHYEFTFLDGSTGNPFNGQVVQVCALNPVNVDVSFTPAGGTGGVQSFISLIFANYIMAPVQFV